MAQSRPGDPGRPGDPVGRFGSTVAGRYRLDEPRHGNLPGAERWTATDQILARRVTVTLVTGPRAAAVLDAARRAALVVDPRLARILDVGTADGTGYVVTEAVDGRSLAALAARAPLAPDQARAVVGEAAAALEVARRRGVHHLALRPESVVLTSGSRVVVEGLAVDGELLDAAGGGAHAMSRTDTVGLVRVLYAALTGRWPAATTTAAVPTFDEWAAGEGDAPSVPVDHDLPAAPDHDGSPAAPADLVPGVPADLDTLCVVTLGPHDDGPHSPGELVRELEPWRAVRADEVFRAADSARWPSLTDSPAPPRPDGGTPTGTTTAPPTGSSPMSDDQQRTSPTADGDTPAEGAPAASTGAGRTAGAGAGGVAAAGGAGAAAAAGAGAAATGTGDGAGAAGAGAAAGATGAAGAAGAGASAGAAASAGAGVARQSVRSAFGAAQGPGTRRPGTPPPAVPVGSRASGPTSDVPSDAAGTNPPSVPPARSGSAAEPAPAAGPEMPPAIPPAGRGTASADRDAASTATRPTSTTPERTGSATAPGDREAGREQGDQRDDRPAAGDAAVAGLAAAAAAASPRPASAAPAAGTASKADAGGTSGAATPATPATPVRRATSAFATVTPDPRPAPDTPAARAPEPEPLDAADAPGGPGAGHPDWDLPFAADEPARGPGQRRFDPTRWVLGLVAIGVVVGVVIAIGNVLRPWDGGGDDSAGAVPVATPTVTAPPAQDDAADDDGAGDDEEAPATDPPVIATVTTIDPSDDDGEHEELVGRLTDGDPATAWYTHTYNRPDFAGFKDAVGLVITLQQPATVSAITLDVNGSGGNVEVRSTDGANPTAGDVLAAGPLSPQTVLTLAQPTETQSIVLWFTALAQAPDGANKIEISTLSVS